MVPFSAEDRVGHVTEVSSQVVIDNTPPVVTYVAAGAVTQEQFISGQELIAHWVGVEDRESGVKSIQVTLSSTPFFVFWLYCAGCLFVIL